MTISGCIYLFNTLQLIPGDSDQKPLEIRSAKLQLLLAYLVLQANRPIDRGELGRELWPQTSEASARRNLREYLYRARQLLADFMPGVEMIEAEEHFVTFNPPPTCWIDTVEFERLTGQANRLDSRQTPEIITLLQQAIDLYQGDLLSGLYEEWIISERERFHNLFIKNLAQLSRALQLNGQLARAIRLTRRLLEQDPLQEETHRQLMELYYLSDDRARALHQFQQLQQILADELDAAPLPETQALYQAILNGTYRQDRPSVSPAPGGVAMKSTPALPFVARQNELAWLTRAANQARTGSNCLVVVTGDSGIGKTRLVTEWLSSLPAETICLRGQGHEFEQDIPYRPLLDALQQALHLIPWQSLPPDFAQAWLSPLAQLLPDLYYYLPNLSPTVAQPDGDIAPHTLESLAQLFLSLARQSPAKPGGTRVVLFIDDLHWADDPTWRFLSFLARRTTGVDLFIVATFSTQETPEERWIRLQTLKQRQLLQLLPLERLHVADVAQLAAQMLDQPGEQLETLAVRLHRETGGNPFFVTEMIKALVESELSPPYTPAQLDHLQLPTAIQTLVRNRLDRLSADNRKTIATAAAIGREFSFDLLATVSQVDEDVLLDYIDDWLARGLLVEAGHNRYDFSHQMVREVAYHSLSRPRRRRIHYRLARALEAQQPVDIESIAHHYHLSDQPASALPALLETGRRALNLRSYQEARSIGQTLLNLLRQVPQATTPQGHLDLDLKWALAYCFTGEVDEALPILEEAAYLAETLNDLAQAGEVARRIAQIYWLRGEAPQARRYAEQALTLVEQTDDPAHKVAVLSLLGRITAAQDDFETSRNYLQQVLGLDVTANPLTRMTLEGYLAIAMAHLQQREEALAALKSIEQIAPHFTRTTVAAVAWVLAAVAYAELGLWAKADSAARRGLSDPEVQELPAYTFLARVVLGRVAHHQGRFDEAYAKLTQAIQLAETDHYRLLRHLGHIYLAEAALERGDHNLVQIHVQSALTLAEQTGNRWTRRRVQPYLKQIEAY